MSFVSRNHPQQVGKRGSLDEVDDRTTPWDVFQPISERFGGFTVDAAAAEHNARCDRYWTRADNGLLQPWDGERVWCNPPYSQLDLWLKKARSSARDAELIVMLVPANRTEQRWWQDHVEPFRDGRDPEGPRTEFWRGRTRFIRPGQTEIGSNERPPFGCCLLIWNCGSVVSAGWLRLEPETETETATRATRYRAAEASRNASSSGPPSSVERETGDQTNMTLGNFVPKSRVAGDKMDLRNGQLYGRPYLLQVQDYSDSFHSKMSNNGQGANVEAVWVDVMDVLTGSVLINVLFTNGAFVDNLKETTGTGTVLPVKFARATGGKFGGYAVLEALEGQELAQAQNAYNSWGNVLQERQRREQLAQQASQGFQGGQQQSPFGQNQQQGGQFQGQQGANPFGGGGQGQQQGGGFQGQQPNNQGGMFGGGGQQQGGQFGQPNQNQGQAFGNQQQGGQQADPNQGQAFGQPNQQQGGNPFGGQPNQGQFQGQQNQDPNQAANMLNQLNNQIG